MYRATTTKEPIVLEPTSVWNQEEISLLEEVESSLERGLTMKRWWECVEMSSCYAERFDLIRAFNRPDKGFGFFDVVGIDDRPLPVMGDVQEMLYDRPKQSGPDRWRAQLREFVLRYFMRITDFRPPVAFVARGGSSPLPGATRFEWCPDARPSDSGFGYSQLYYKRHDTGQVGKFADSERFAIVDLRELTAKYDWIVAKVRIFDFNLRFGSFTADGPEFVFPLREENVIILSPEFITDRETSAPDGSAEFGFGYALLHGASDDGLLAYGPGRFAVGFQLINFRVSNDGEIRVRLAFGVNRPERIVKVPLNPVQLVLEVADRMTLGITSKLFGVSRWAANCLTNDQSFDPLLGSIGLANLATAGLAGKEFCISKEQLEKAMLLQHFMQHYEMILGSLFTWRQIPNWLDTAALPRWVVNGVES